MAGAWGSDLLLGWCSRRGRTQRQVALQRVHRLQIKYWNELVRNCNNGRKAPRCGVWSITLYNHGFSVSPAF